MSTLDAGGVSAFFGRQRNRQKMHFLSVGEGYKIPWDINMREDLVCQPTVNPNLTASLYLKLLGHQVPTCT